MTRGGARATHLAPVIAPVSIVGSGLTLLAAARLTGANPERHVLLGALLLLLASVVAEAFPVPVEGVSAGGVSLAAAFLVGAAVVYGWELATVLGFLTRAAIEVAHRRPLSRLAHNASTYALAAAAAGGVTASLRVDLNALTLAVGVAAASLCFYAVNVSLIALIVSRATGTRFDDIVLTSVRWTIVPFSIMA